MLNYAFLKKTNALDSNRCPFFVKRSIQKCFLAADKIIYEIVQRHCASEKIDLLKKHVKMNQIKLVIY